MKRPRGKSGHLPVPKLAYKDPQFMESLPARPLRILAEYLDPLNRLRQASVGDTIVMFGSARIQSRERALAHLKQVQARARGRRDSEWRTKIAASRSLLAMSRYYEEARELSHRITSWAMTLGDQPRRFVICSGGGPGIMEAANRGAWEAGGKTIGLNISLPFEQMPNRYITPALNFEFHYFFMRKYWFAYLAKALVVFPGGFGTLDEMFEILTLSQTQKLAKKITVVLYGSSYWQQVINLDVLIEKGAISPRDRELFQVADSTEQAFEILRDGLTRNHLERESAQEADLPDIAQTRR
jgi:uncharacterized protein (TIGR00730 family)